MKLPQKIEDSLRTVTSYNSDECADYAEFCEYTRGSGRTHIYEHITLLKLWLEFPNTDIEELQRAANQHLDELRREHAASHAAWAAENTRAAAEPR